MSTTADAFDCVLIDDDELVRLMWRLAAEGVGKRLLVLAQSADFWARSSHLSPSVPIYVDYNLPPHLAGDAFARQLAAAGFTNIYFQTGHDVASISTLTRPWLKGVIGKEPPWL